VDTYREVFVSYAGLVNEWIFDGRVSLEIHIVDAVHQDRNRSVEHVEALDNPLSEQLLARPAVEEVEPELRDLEEDILVEDKADEITHADVVEATVLQQQRRQVAELSDGVVRGVHSLYTFLAFDADADVALLWSTTTII
jgi:hypothetical protein